MSTADLPPRRRRRAQRAAGPPVTGEQQPAVPGRTDEPAAPATPRTRRQGGRRSRTGEQSTQHGREADRGWRELAGSTPSQLGVSGALRARDVARPGPDELAAAERDLEIVRRQWQPPAEDPPISR